jgi:Na+/H+ antiporter NhaD/arsenite permease-like protein
MKTVFILMQVRASALFRAGSVLMGLVAIVFFAMTFFSDGVTASWVTFTIAGVLLALAQHFHEESISCRGSVNSWDSLS